MNSEDGITRRDFIKLGAAAGGWRWPAADGEPPSGAAADGLPYLDRNMYRSNTDVLAIFDPGTTAAPRCR